MDVVDLELPKITGYHTTESKGRPLLTTSMRMYQEDIYSFQTSHEALALLSL
jgi:hypothetical protein